MTQMTILNEEWKTLSHLYDVVIKQQPEAVALDDGDVVSAVGTTAVWRERGENKGDMLWK